MLLWLEIYVVELGLDGHELCCGIGGVTDFLHRPDWVQRGGLTKRDHCRYLFNDLRINCHWQARDVPLHFRHLCVNRQIGYWMASARRST